MSFSRFSKERLQDGLEEGFQGDFGLLGRGFLGERLLSAMGGGSFFADRNPGAKGILFDWADPSTFANLPRADLGKEGLPLVLTIPPVHPEPEREEERLHDFGRWMKEHRPGCPRMVYLSSAAVYPKEPGLYDETSAPDNPETRGQLRRLTERVLGEYFELKVIRPGGIYGKGRNLLVRQEKGLAFRGLDQSVGRIHVTDLARLTLLALFDEEFPALVNGADPNPGPSREILEWLRTEGQEIGNLPPKEERPLRRLTSQALKDYSYPWRYPDYKAGYRAILKDEPETPLF